jgi:hypothetical protein
MIKQSNESNEQPRSNACSPNNGLDGGVAKTKDANAMDKTT